jgi:hypothetical protein
LWLEGVVLPRTARELTFHALTFVFRTSFFSLFPFNR